MYQPIQFKNTTILLALAILTILCANISFAQVDYSTLNYPGGAMGSSTFLTGIRGAGGENVYITGFYALAGETNGQGLFYQGLLDGSGDWTLLNFPSSPGVTVTSTTLYGPDALSSNNVRLVGSYKTQETGGRSIMAALFSPGSRSLTRSRTAQWADLSSATLIRTLRRAGPSFTTSTTTPGWSW